MAITAKRSTSTDEAPPSIEVAPAPVYVQPVLGFYRPHAPVQALNDEPSMTKQSFKDECDINNILSQFKMTGIISHINEQQPMFTDLPSDFDYQSSLHTIMQAEESFAALPSMVRDYFSNDPQQFLAAFGSEDGRAKLTEWGIITPKPAREPATDPNPIPAKTE